METQNQVRLTDRPVFIFFLVVISIGTQIPTLRISYANSYPENNQFIYLPIVMKPCDTSIIPNGNFEQGVDAWWEKGFYVLPGDYIRSDFDNPHSGEWVAAIRAKWLTEFGSIEQNVSVPSNNHYLAYWYWVEAIDMWCPGRCLAAYVQINGTTVRTHYLSYDSTEWQKDVIDLIGYAGQTVNLRFYVLGNTHSSPLFVVDDVFYQSCPTK